MDLIETNNLIKEFNKREAALAIGLTQTVLDAPSRKNDLDTFENEKIERFNNFIIKYRQFAIECSDRKIAIEQCQDLIHAVKHNIKSRILIPLAESQEEIFELDRSYRVNEQKQLVCLIAYEHLVKIDADIEGFLKFEYQELYYRLLNIHELILHGLEMLEKELSSLPETSLPIDPIELEAASHKIVLLHELGIVDFLKKKYYDATNPDHKGGTVDLTSLLSVITDIKTSTMRKGIQSYKMKGDKGNNYTDKAIKEVNKIFIDVKIKPIEQPEKNF
jgi:hypothetical protein